MIIDNFNLIGNYLSDYKQKLFYDCSIIRRGKDHPNLPAANRVIKHYFVESPNYLESCRKEIISLCEEFGARAYINLAPKSYEKLAKLTAWRLNERIFSGDFQKIYKCFDSCAGELKGEKPAWIVDIDDKQDEYPVMKWLIAWFTAYPLPQDKQSKCIELIVPTLSGCHLITSSFNIQDFKKEFPTIDVHKNNPTLLYCNSDLFSK